MSETYIDIRRVEDVYPHPDADNLKVARIGKFVVVIHKDMDIQPNQNVIHFPTDICIDPEIAVELGVSNYLRKARYQNEGDKVRCRIVAARLRGIPSQGFIVELDSAGATTNFDEYYGAHKYEPPVFDIATHGEVEREDYGQFPRYTKIRRIQYQASAWTEGLPVRVTEKIHGMNARFGVVQMDGEWRFMVGSHNRILRQMPDYKKLGFWDLLDERVMELLNYCCDGSVPVVVYGERYGPGVQDLDYGLQSQGLRVFDIMIDGAYQDWHIVKEICRLHNVPTVPLLYQGPFSWCGVDHFTNGLTLVSQSGKIHSKYKGREGIVITPLEETLNPRTGDRLIAKAISVDYEARRGGTEYN